MDRREEFIRYFLQFWHDHAVDSGHDLLDLRINADATAIEGVIRVTRGGLTDPQLYGRRHTCPPGGDIKGDAYVAFEYIEPFNRRKGTIIDGIKWFGIGTGPSFTRLGPECLVEVSAHDSNAPFFPG